MEEEASGRLFLFTYPISEQTVIEVGAAERNGKSYPRLSAALIDHDCSHRPSISVEVSSAGKLAALLLKFGTCRSYKML